ncbi:MAG TPA: tetratricopeptide repeat protein [Thermoanaerobaculia bacterium]|nr:tetratricopeptide repeat protein [Thermoanaerobaculia bacterium]
MRKWLLLLLTVASFAVPAGAQEFPNEPYEFLLAKLAAAEGRFDEAIQHLNSVIEKQPDDPVLRYERAMMLIDSGRIDRAEAELRAVIEKNPDLYDAQRVLGRLLLDRAGNDRKRVDQALVHLQAAFKLNPDDLSSGIASAQIYMSTNRFQEAERLLAAMVERAPDHRALNYHYAHVLTKLGRGNESRAYLERSLAAEPTFGPAVMQLLDIYQQENEWSKAAEILQPLIDEEPANIELLRQQAYFYLRGGAARKARDRFKALTVADPKDPRLKFFLAEALNDLEEYAESEKIFRELLTATPDDAEMLGSFGMSLIGQKRWDEAAATFNKLLGRGDIADHLAALARTQLAHIDMQRGNYEAAIETAKSIFVFRDRPNAQAINIALMALRKQERTADAIALLEPLAAKFDSDPFVNARYVEALVRAGQKEKAQKHAAVQAKLGTRNAITAAEAYVAAGDHAEAVSLLQTAIAAKPEEVDLQFELGSVQERAGDKKAAEKTFLAVLEKSENHAPTLNYLGYMWAESAVNLDRAHEMLTRAVGQEPENGAYVDSLGWIYFRLNKLDLAEKYLTDATRLLPRDATVHEHLGDLFAKRGDAERALKSYRTALDLDPEGKEVEKLRSKIAEIERKGQTSQR